MANVIFRNFEPRDLEFVHQCKTDEKINRLVVGNWKPFTKEQSKAWLDGCIRADNPAYKFWAIAVNDEEKRIIGWCSLSQIDLVNKSACFHGIIIGDDNYRDGMAWIQSFLYIYEYVFEKLGLNRLYGSNIEDQKASYYMGLAMCETLEGVARHAVLKNGKYNNVQYMSILKEEYFLHKTNGDFELPKILRRLASARK